MADFFLGGETALSPGDAAAAIIALPGKRYLMQLRDQMPKVFYPGHWGVFGGAMDAGESPEQCLYRELKEELGLSGVVFRPFASLGLDFSYCGLENVMRHYFSGEIDEAVLGRLRLGEGREMRVFSASELLSMPRVVPYDSVAIWMHATKDSIRMTRASR